jgi:hypothetical protein
MRPNSTALKLALLMTLCGSWAGAQAASISINPATATALTTGGATTPAGLQVQFTGDAPGASAVVGYQTDIDFDNTQMSVSLTNGNADSCVMLDANTIRIIDVDPGLNPLPSGTACTLTFTVNAGQTAGTMYPVNVNGTLCSDSMGGMQACGENDGTINIVAGPQPEFDATPAAPGPLNINGSIGSPGSTPISVNNDLGDVGSTLTLSVAAADGSATGTLTVNPTMGSVAQGAADAVFTVTCDSTIAEMYTGTVTFTTNDSDDGEGTVVYNVNCNITAAPAPEFASTPAAGSTITINDPVGGGGTTSTLNVQNTGNANLTVTPSGLSAPLAITPTGTSTIAGGANQDFTITCTATSGGTTTQTLTLTTNDADEGTNTYTVNCVGIAPEYSSVPAAPGPIAITDVAGDMAGTTATLTVSNTGTSDLTVTPSGLSGILSISPTGTTTIMSGGSQAYTITCNATDAIDASQTLTMTTNDADEGTVTYTVTCNATGPEISTTPPSGGTVNFQGFMGSTVNGSVSITNQGDALLTVSGCMLGGANPGSFTTAAGTTVNPGATGSLALTCTAPAAGTTVTATLTCNTDDLSEPTITYNLSCLGINPSIPTLNDYGKLLMVALVLGLGLLGFALRRSA